MRSIQDSGYGDSKLYYQEIKGDKGQMHGQTSVRIHSLSVSKFKTIFLSFLMLLLATACVREEEMDNTPQGNFEALWQMIDERYCFFDYKRQEYGLDWDEVYARYAPMITPDMPSKGLFEVLGNMLAELRRRAGSRWRRQTSSPLICYAAVSLVHADAGCVLSKPPKAEATPWHRV